MSAAVATVLSNNSARTFRASFIAASWRTRIALDRLAYNIILKIRVAQHKVATFL